MGGLYLSEDPPEGSSQLVSGDLHFYKFLATSPINIAVLTTKGGKATKSLPAFLYGESTNIKILLQGACNVSRYNGLIIRLALCFDKILFAWN